MIFSFEILVLLCNFHLYCSFVSICVLCSGILDLAIVERGRNIVSVSRDGTAKLWDCGRSACLATFDVEGGVINGCCLGVPSSDLDLGQPAVPPGSKFTSCFSLINAVFCNFYGLNTQCIQSQKQKVMCNLNLRTPTKIYNTYLQKCLVSYLIASSSPSPLWPADYTINILSWNIICNMSRLIWNLLNFEFLVSHTLDISYPYWKMQTSAPSDSFICCYLSDGWIDCLPVAQQYWNCVACYKLKFCFE